MEESGLLLLLLTRVPRPDKQEDYTGLKFVGEVPTCQSDHTLVELHLRAVSKRLHCGDAVVRTIDDVYRNPLAIDRWILGVEDLHRTEPAPQVLNFHTYRGEHRVSWLQCINPFPHVLSADYSVLRE
jgi:Intraflagellar transport complex B protein 46 C terminal